MSDRPIRRVAIGTANDFLKVGSRPFLKDVGSFHGGESTAARTRSSCNCRVRPECGLSPLRSRRVAHIVRGRQLELLREDQSYFLAGNGAQCTVPRCARVDEFIKSACAWGIRKDRIVLFSCWPEDGTVHLRILRRRDVRRHLTRMDTGHNARAFGQLRPRSQANLERCVSRVRCGERSSRYKLTLAPRGQEALS
jgi:hypothetical protein